MTAGAGRAAAGRSAGGRRRLEEVQPAAVADEWDSLSERCGNPFLSTAWLLPWTSAYARRARWFVLRDSGGRLAAAACLVPLRGGGLGAAANIETSHWDVAAADPDARRQMWELLAARAGGRLRLTALPAGESLPAVRQALRAAGYRVVERPDLGNPRLELPASWNELLSGVSHNLRSQYRRKLRSLAGGGVAELRITTGGPELARDLRTFLRLEASGWKGRRGTAVIANPAAEMLYRGFAERAAVRGWLRLALLEVDGRAVAGDLSCAFAGGTFMLKTAYDEQFADRSPGLVLRGEALRAAITAGSRFYDFTGGAEPYKLRWGGTPRPYVDVAAYRGRYAPVGVFSQYLRPALGGVRAQLFRLARPDQRVASSRDNSQAGSSVTANSTAVDSP